MFRLGVVGGGRMGQTHMRALHGSSVVTVVAVAEPVAESAARLRLAGATVYPTVADMMAEAALDGVLVAAPSGFHLDVVGEVAAAGLPILCEKPCGLTADDAASAASLASRHGVFLQVGYWRRFVPALQSLRQQILDGSMGELLALNCAQWDERPPSAQFRTGSGGIFVDMGVHEIDELLWLTGQTVESVVAARQPAALDTEAMGDVDSAQALLVLSGGTVASISLGRYFPGGDLVTAEAFATEGHERVTVLEPITADDAQMDALRRQAEAFVANCGGASAGGATAQDAATTLRVAEQLTIAAGLTVLGHGAP